MELILCTPALPLKPLFYEALMDVEASSQEQAAIRHAPKLNGYGFWALIKRGEPWTFITWGDWFRYWLVPSLLWFFVYKKLERIHK
jgi:hypothetical protein